MAIVPSYPGVYVQEIPSGVRTITGVSTSVAAFIGFFRKGPMSSAKDATRVLSFNDFERAYGGLDKDSEASYAIYQFFLNGGTEAWIVRTASGDPQAANIDAKDVSGASEVIKFTAKNPGAWGNYLGAFVDFNTEDPERLFNVTTYQYGSSLMANDIVLNETIRNLSMEPGASNYVVDVMGAQSELVNAEVLVDTSSDPATFRPTPCGILSGKLDPTVPDLQNQSMTVTVETSTGETLTLAEVSFDGTVEFANYGQVALEIQTQIRNASTDTEITAYTSGVLYTVTVEDSGHAYINFYITLPKDPAVILKFEGGLATALLMDEGNAQAINVQIYSLGTGATFGMQVGFDATSGGDDTFIGTDGTFPTASEIIGDPQDRTGMYALDEVEVFNLLSIPIIRTYAVGDPEYSTIVTAANQYCQQRYALFLMDIPQSIVKLTQMEDWINDNGSLRSSYNAVYYPNTLIADPLNDYRLRSVAPSGTMAGVYTVTDANRGVWKAPAGTEAVLANVAELEYLMTNQENGVLNPLGVNCLRNFTAYGNTCWGARTTDGADTRSSEWKYIPVRRTALYIEESLLISLQWAVFEPNDEPLWAQIRLNVGAFLNGMYTQGAFFGSSSTEAYFVKCDSSTTTANDIDKGIVNILVGFAPLKPAEFVIISIQQIAGQLQT